MKCPICGEDTRAVYYCECGRAYCPHCCNHHSPDDFYSCHYCGLICGMAANNPSEEWQEVRRRLARDYLEYRLNGYHEISYTCFFEGPIDILEPRVFDCILSELSLQGKNKMQEICYKLFEYLEPGSSENSIALYGCNQ